MKVPNHEGGWHPHLGKYHLIFFNHSIQVWSSGIECLQLSLKLFSKIKYSVALKDIRQRPQYLILNKNSKISHCMCYTNQISTIYKTNKFQKTYQQTQTWFFLHSISMNLQNMFQNRQWANIVDCDLYFKQST